jgi:hypothetical protein
MSSNNLKSFVYKLCGQNYSSEAGKAKGHTRLNKKRVRDRYKQGKKEVYSWF